VTKGPSDNSESRREEAYEPPYAEEQDRDLQEDRWRSDLRALFGEAGENAGPPSALRESIRLRAALVLRARRRQRRQRVAGGVAAACLLVVVGSIFLFDGPGPPAVLRDESLALPVEATAVEASREESPRGDLDGNGRIDVRDARRLALAIRAGATEGDQDLDGNGLVDDGDVDLLMQRAVSLESR
jgi:hypothetical protein